MRDGGYTLLLLVDVSAALVPVFEPTGVSTRPSRIASASSRVISRSAPINLVDSSMFSSFSFTFDPLTYFLKKINWYIIQNQ